MDRLEEIKLGDYWHCKECGIPIKKGKLKCDRCIKRSQDEEKIMDKLSIYGYKQYIKELGEQTERKDKEIERLRKDLKEYGKHKKLCLLDYGANCCCGFEQALKEGRNDL